MRYLLLLTALCCPLPAQSPPPAEPVSGEEPWLTGSVDLGYRWVTGVGGSFDTYRSVVDLGSGPKLLGTEFTILDPKRRLFDRLNVRAYNWGDDPYSTFHLDAKKAKIYDFTADYRNIAYYNNLPSFADPLLGTGVVLNEQSLDTHQRFSSFRLDLMPGNWLIPYLAYERNSNTGTGADTFVTDGNEYPVVNLVRSSTSNYRGGVRMELSRWHVTLEEGGTTSKDDEQLSQGAGQTNSGNVTSPLLGQTLNLTSLAENWGVRGSSIYSKGLLTANVTSWLDLYGQFLYSQPESTVHFQDYDTGHQVLLSEVLFYTAGQSLINSVSKMPHTSASFGAEIRPFKRLRIVPSWLTDRMHTSGADIAQQSFSTTTATTSVNSLFNSELINNYNQAEINLMYDLTSKITLRGGYRYVWGDASQVILPIAGLSGLDQGRIRRNIALAGFTYRPFRNLSIDGEFDDGSSGSTYFSTSLYDYQKARARGRYQILPDLSVSATVTVLANKNPTAGSDYHFLAHQESLSLFYVPSGGKRWDVQAGYTRSTLRSDIDYLDPEFLTPERSLYRDNGHTATALFNANVPLHGSMKARLSFGGSLFISSGSNPSRFYQPTGKLSIPFRKNIAWITEWRYYGFDQSFYLYQGFRTQMVTTGVRLTR